MFQFFCLWFPTEPVNYFNSQIFSIGTTEIIIFPPKMYLMIYQLKTHSLKFVAPVYFLIQ